MVIIGPLEKLGTKWWFELYDAAELDKEKITELLTTELDRFNAAYSRFRPDSVLSTLNQEGSVTNPSPEFLDLLHIAVDAYSETHGVFNIAIKNKLEAIGYDAEYSFVAAEEIPEVPKLTDVLTLSQNEIILKDGWGIDFGGFGKGYAIDLLAELLRQQGISEFCINGGGDMYVSSQTGEPITIGLQHPHNETLIGSLPLRNQGFAASSPNLRQWKDQNGNTQQHLVGSDAPSSVYVVAPNAVTADIWATTLSIAPSTPTPKNIKAWQWDEGEAGLAEII